MMIWFILLIPIVAILILLFNFKRQMTWWEYVLLFIIPVAVIAITKVASVSSQTKDYEVWNAYLTSARYVEAWSTWVVETCSKEVCTGSGDDRRCHTEYYDCSYCNDHREYWEAYDNLGNSYRISESQFNYLCSKWKNKTFKELNRRIKRHGSCGVDGDEYITQYNNVFEDMVPIASRHNYENKIQASKSVFNFQKVDTVDIRELGLYEYPPIDMWNYNPIIGGNSIAASQRLQKWNGKLGSFKQVHILICVYKNKPFESALMQENYWVGGNKNEFILCIGLDDENKIEWTHVISWTEQEKLKIDVREDVKDMPYDLMKIVDYTADKVSKQFVRKKFADYDYISIKPTGTAIVVAFIITLVLTIGLSVFFVLNPCTYDNPMGY